MTDNDHIRRQLDRYHRGESTPAEVNELIRWFDAHVGNIPPEFARDAQMLASLSGAKKSLSGRPLTPDREAALKVSVARTTAMPRHKRHLWRIATLGVVAAAIALWVIVPAAISRENQPAQPAVTAGTAHQTTDSVDAVRLKIDPSNRRLDVATH